MARTFSDLVKDYENDPTQWEVIRSETVPSTTRRNRGGTSIQELLRHRASGEEMVRHTLVKPSGDILDRHFRRTWK